jgi:hypothetical protein
MIERALAYVRSGASFEAAPRRLRTRSAGGKRFQANAARSARTRAAIDAIRPPPFASRCAADFIEGKTSAVREKGLRGITVTLA